MDIEETDLMHGFTIDQFPNAWIKILMEYAEINNDVKEFVKSIVPK